MLVLFVFVIPCMVLIWIVRLVLLYQKGKSARYSFNIQVLVLILSMSVVLWTMGIYPYSRNIEVMSKTEALTGKSFWVWKEYSFDEFGFRGEGYSFDMFRFDDEIAAYFKEPGRTFFQKYPLALEYGAVTWKKTPVVKGEKHLLEFATLSSGGHSQEKKEMLQFVREIGNSEGALYAYRGEKGNIDFFIIAPEKNLIILINHNM